MIVVRVVLAVVVALAVTAAASAAVGAIYQFGTAASSALRPRGTAMFRQQPA